jgi:Fe-S cluster assembly protein SufD
VEIFSRARFGLDQISGLANPKESLTFQETPLNDGIRIDLLDRLILDEPHALTSLPKISGPELGADDFSYLTGAFAQTGFLLRASKGAVVRTPLVIEHHEPEAGKIAFHHSLIELEANAEVTLIEKFTGAPKNAGGFISNLLKVNLGEGARLNRIVIQECSSRATVVHLENFLIGKNGYLNTSNLHLGGAQSRIESKGVLKESGAHFEYGSIFLGDHEQLFDQRTIQVHQAPHCTSNLLCKNALRKEAKSIFSGLIKVDEDAQHTDAYQTNRNLLLSSEAEADSLPGLEILANEVKCSHGATTSRIDPQELFYLHSRGIHKTEAEKLIALGFLSESLNNIQHEETRELLLNTLADSLSS